MRHVSQLAFKIVLTRDLEVDIGVDKTRQTGPICQNRMHKTETGWFQMGWRVKKPNCAV
jgi:hypothetical protein